MRHHWQQMLHAMNWGGNRQPRRLVVSSGFPTWAVINLRSLLGSKSCLRKMIRSHCVRICGYQDKSSTAIKIFPQHEPYPNPSNSLIANLHAPVKVLWTAATSTGLTDFCTANSKLQNDGWWPEYDWTGSYQVGLPHPYFCLTSSSGSLHIATAKRAAIRVWQVQVLAERLRCSGSQLADTWRLYSITDKDAANDLGTSSTTKLSCHRITIHNWTS